MSRLVSAPRADRLGSVRRFDPKFWTTDAALRTSVAILTVGEDGLDQPSVFRRNDDLSGAIWLTEHRFDHPWFRYATVPDYTGTVFEFSLEVAGEGAPLAGVLGPSVTITTTGGTDHLVRLWKYRADPTNLNVTSNRFRLVFDGTLRTGFDADGPAVPVTDIARILIPLVPRDYQGGTTCTLQTVIVQGGSYSTIAVRVPGGRAPVAGDVLSIWPGTLATDDHVQRTVASAVAAGGGYPSDTFLITPTVALDWPWANTIAIGAPCQISTATAGAPLRAENAATLKLRDIVVSGPRSVLLADARPLPAHAIAMTDGWDNAYPLTPALVVDRCLSLGYRGPFVWYAGISHFHWIKWDPALVRDGVTGGWVIDTAAPAINAPTALWFADFAERLEAAGFDLWVSVSFEILNDFCPPAWRQLDAEGNPALTGWSPPSTLVSVANEDALDYLAKVAVELLDIAVAAGLSPRYQIGEPWHWVSVYEPGDPTPLPNPADWAPCIYDPALEAAYVAETELPVPTPRLTSVVVDDTAFAANAAYFAFCRESLGAATLALTAAVTAEHPSVQTALLLFTPQVLSDVARVLPAINRPLAAQWGPANFDVLMLEHYDWAVEGAFEKFALTWAFATAELGWPLDRLYHFVGFVLDGEDAATLWPRIGVDLADALARGPAQVFVWSREQVWRDGWLYEAPIDLSPAPSLPDPLAAPAIDAFVPSIHASLPLGPAWRTPDRAAFDEDSWMGRFWRAVADPFVRLYADAWGVKEEAAAPSLSAVSLADWEQELKLPDPCTGLADGFAARKTAVREKLVAAPVVRPADFVALAARLGWTVTIEEPRGFECGHSQCGWGDELSDLAIEFQPVFRVANAETTAFELGEGECGVTAITDFRPAADLVCRVREVIGADLEPGFHYRDASAPPLVLAPPPLAAAVFETDGASVAVAGLSDPFAVVSIEIED